MGNILTPIEAANVLRCAEDDPNLFDLLPIVDAYLKNATGHDWAADVPVLPEAKAAARILLVQAHEDPGAMTQPAAVLGWGLTASLAQLKALAAEYWEFTGRVGAGACTLVGAQVGDTVKTLTGLIGVAGDQKAAFETVITVADQIQQVSASDHSSNWFRAHLVPVGVL